MPNEHHSEKPTEGELLLFARRLVEEADTDRDISDEEIQACLEAAKQLPPEYEAVAQKRLTPEQIQKIVSGELDNLVGEKRTQSVASQRSEDSRKDKDIGQLSRPPSSPSSEAFGSKAMHTDLSKIVGALRQELRDMLRGGLAQMFATEAPLRASDRQAPVFSCVARDGSTRLEGFPLENGNLRVIVSSRNLDLAGHLLKLVFGKGPPLAVLLKRTGKEQNLVLGHLIVHRESLPANISECDIDLVADP